MMWKIAIIALSIVTLAAPVPAQAQTFPSQRIYLLVPFPPGGGPDVLSRMIGQRLSNRFSQPVVVENKPGAGGILGTGIGSRATPDGHTLVFADSGTMSIIPHLGQQLPYDPFKSFVPVTLASSNPLLMVVSPKLQVASLKEFLDLVRAQPGKLSYGSPGIGTVHHIAIEQLKHKAGLDIVHVPFKGIVASLPSLLTGEIAMVFISPPSVVSMVKEGKLRALATGGDRRLEALPEVPTFAEAGMPGFTATINFGYLVPTGTPADVVAHLSREIASIVRAEDVRLWLAKQGMEAVGSSPAEYLAASQAESARYADIIKATGIRNN